LFKPILCTSDWGSKQNSRDDTSSSSLSSTVCEEIQTKSSSPYSI